MTNQTTNQMTNQITNEEMIREEQRMAQIRAEHDERRRRFEEEVDESIRRAKAELEMAHLEKTFEDMKEMERMAAEDGIKMVFESLNDNMWRVRVDDYESCPTGMSDILHEACGLYFKAQRTRRIAG